MSVSQLDVAIRAGAVVTILLLAWLMVNNRKHLGLPAALFVPLAVCLSGFLIGNTPVSSLRPAGLFGSIAHIASGLTVVYLWWFCLSCFDRRFSLNGSVLGIGLAWAIIAGFDRGMFGDSFASKGLSIALVAFGFLIVGHLVWRLMSERQSDLILPRHDARIIVAVLLGGMLFIDLTADLLFGFAWRPHEFALIQNVLVLAFGIWLAGKLLSVRVDILSFGMAPEEVLASEPPPRPGNPLDGELLRRLTALMKIERIFLDPDLTFATFVDRMGAPARTVRTLVNREMGFDHFRTFLNHHKVAEACRLLGGMTHTDDKLIAIALDSGFSSLASFNRVFKAVKACTPSQYRASVMPGMANKTYLAKGGF